MNCEKVTVYDADKLRRLRQNHAACERMRMLITEFADECAELMGIETIHEKHVARSICTFGTQPAEAIVTIANLRSARNDTDAINRYFESAAIDDEPLAEAAGMVSEDRRQDEIAEDRDRWIAQMMTDSIDDDRNRNFG